MTKNYYSRKPYKIKTQKPIFKKKYFWNVFLMLITAVGIFYLVVFSPIFQIKEVEIGGNQKLAAKDLKDAINGQIERKITFFTSKSIFLINGADIKEIFFKKFPQIEELNLKRKLPDILFLEIKEKQPFGLWCRDYLLEKENTENSDQNQQSPQVLEKCFYFDKSGVIFENAAVDINPIMKIKKSGDSGNFELGQKVIDENTLKSIAGIYKKLKEDLNIGIKEFIIASDKKLTSKTFENWEIYFDLSGNIDFQITKLGALLKEKVLSGKRGNFEYVDLMFDKIYYK